MMRFRGGRGTSMMHLVDGYPRNWGIWGQKFVRDGGENFTQSYVPINILFTERLFRSFQEIFLLLFYLLLPDASEYHHGLEFH